MTHDTNGAELSKIGLVEGERKNGEAGRKGGKETLAEEKKEK